MDKEKLRQRLMGIFLGELDRYVSELDHDLNGLEQPSASPPFAERIERMHRQTHAIKGASRTAGIPALQRACYALELRLVAVKDGRCPLDADLLHLLQEAAPAFRESSERLHANEPEPGPLLEALLLRLESAGNGATAP